MPLEIILFVSVLFNLGLLVKIMFMDIDRRNFQHEMAKALTFERHHGNLQLQMYELRTAGSMAYKDFLYNLAQSDTLSVDQMNQLNEVMAKQNELADQMNIMLADFLKRHPTPPNREITL